MILLIVVRAGSLDVIVAFYFISERSVVYGNSKL